MSSTVVPAPENGSPNETIFAHGDALRLRYWGVINCGVGDTFHHQLHNDPDVTEIELVIHGDEDLLIDGKSYRARAGDLVIFNQSVWHEEMTVPGLPFHGVWVNLEGLQVSGLPPGYFVDRAHPPIISMGDSAFAIEQRFAEIGRASRERGRESNGIVNHLLAILLSEIADVVYPTRDQSERDTRSRSSGVLLAQRYIHANYGQAMSLADIGDAANVDRFYICRAFRQTTGYTPMKYLAKYRMDVAKHYLRKTDDKIAAVAAMVGYQSETHFQNLFHRIVGTTPGQYRQKHRARSHE